MMPEHLVRVLDETELTCLETDGVKMSSRPANMTLNVPTALLRWAVDKHL